MKKEFQVTLGKVLALVAAALVFGCAPPPPASPVTADRAAAMRSASSSAALVNGGASGSWTCPSSPNVLLKDNISINGTWDYTGADDYKVCVASGSGSSPTAFKVTGSTASRLLCIYPMHAGSSGAPKLVASPQCYSVTGAAILPNFATPSATINYMLIVDGNFTEAMDSCLSDTTSCPAHSEGFIQ
ncbi:MAG: hypothetical protein HY075_07640 [Deltaproteobacteria bacterium]|nr:hypothetical protein [Deltaproteobacteria bacterium]